MYKKYDIKMYPISSSIIESTSCTTALKMNDYNDIVFNTVLEPIRLSLRLSTSTASSHSNAHKSCTTKNSTRTSSDFSQHQLTLVCTYCWTPCLSLSLSLLYKYDVLKGESTLE